MIQPFYLIITDRDKNRFNVVGPMTDDTEWINKVSHCQDEGRKVNCQTGSRVLSKEELIREVTKNLGLKFSGETVI